MKLLIFGIPCFKTLVSTKGSGRMPAARWLFGRIFGLAGGSQRLRIAAFQAQRLRKEGNTRFIGQRSNLSLGFISFLRSSFSQGRDERWSLAQAIPWKLPGL